MANTAHLVRRQSSRDLKPQKSVDRLEMKEMRGRLVAESRKNTSATNYGATNAGFDDSSPNMKNKGAGGSSSGPVRVGEEIVRVAGNEAGIAGVKLGSNEGKAIFRPEAGEDERENWDSKLTFLLATVGYAVGLGNVWRFPYLAQKNGGGAFLIPYFVMLAIEGIPIFYLELVIGQRLRKGAIGVWNQVSPYLGGIGSFQSELPWAECPNKYFQNGSYAPEPECQESSPTQYFWYRTTLMISKDINTPEVFNWKIGIALVIAWILVYMCMIKGIASSGKVVYVTATFPYIVLIIFFFRGVTLPGMSDGLRHLFTPKWWTLTDPVVWLEAGTQIFFSLGLAFGGLIAFSSYNPVNNNCYRDAIMVSLTNCFTSMFAGIVVFSIIGFKATMVYEQCLKDRNSMLINIFGHSERIPGDIPLAGTLLNFTNGNGSLDNIIMPELVECDLEKELDNSASGTGLAFIIFTEAINQFPGAQFWSVLFFLMLFTLGIDSQFGTLEGVVTSIVDLKLFPNLRKEILTGGICLICCIISMGFAHGAGSYVFADDIELMTGTRPGLYWLICWKYLSPLAMLSILVASFIEIVCDGSGYQAWVSSEGVTERHEWPTWAIVLIFILIMTSVLWIPAVAIFRYFGILIIDDNEKAWFPAEDLKEFHGIVPHEVTAAETFLFCIRADGSEGMCCPTGGPNDDDDDHLT
ncbi:hypothetical protein PV325_009842 [Microctonus aethiopoides]|nr:hypothetical protein PV325_009842 [Microctonus aethiopoides]